MKNSISNSEGRIIVDRLISTIHKNREFLSDIDGKIGDGDHGINMDKGFQLASSRLDDGMSLSESLRILGRTLLMEIGGSMGPLYGQFFKAMAKVSKQSDEIGVREIATMLDAAYGAIQELGEAKPGDKTLVDTLDPAVSAMNTAATANADLSQALDDMLSAAEKGWKSTENMVAKIGRSSRLGERSRGVLDAGATSCYLILKSITETIREMAS